MISVLMACGHVAQGVNEKQQPVCAICVGIDPKAEIIAPQQYDLSNRFAKCSYGHVGDGKRTKWGTYEATEEVVPSSYDLPFFEYLGPDSNRSFDMCKCGYFYQAHTEKVRFPIVDHEFEPHGPWEFDRYYCGCRGWD